MMQADLSGWSFVDGHVIDADHLNAKQSLKLHPLDQPQWLQRTVRYLYSSTAELCIAKAAMM